MKEIPGFPGYFANEAGEIFSSRRGALRKLKDFVGSHGYKYVNIGRDDGKIVHVGVHRLVLLAFCGPAPSGQEARHLDGIRTNNCGDNLCWGTRQENAQDRFRHGTVKPKKVKPWLGSKGQHNGRAKLTPEDVRSIRRYHESGLLERNGLAALFNVTSTCIDKIVKRERWSHI
jgi:hypothetical protein